MGSPRLRYGSLQPSPDTLTRFKGPTSKGGRVEKGRDMEGEERNKRRAEERGGEDRLPIPNSWIRHCLRCVLTGHFFRASELHRSHKVRIYVYTEV